MSLHAQSVLDLHNEIIVDLFAGGGGASSGIEEATGRMVDIAINHNPVAVGLHEANHPQTIHYRADVFEVCPKKATEGRPVGLLWASPDCTYHSKARGSKPIRHANKKRRALAWVVTRWAGQARPRTIFLENVEEFVNWGPLVGTSENLRPCKRRRGKTFRKFVTTLRLMGYRVEWRELRACDYGAPTIRKRLFMIARCDGEAITWPEPTHGPGRAHPYVPVSDCIDWSIPMCSIFATPEEAKAWAKFHKLPTPIRPLAAKSMARIGRGVKRFVIDNPNPFIIHLTHAGARRSPCVEEPLSTITTANRGEHAIVAPITVGVGGRAGQIPERSVENPLQTITAKADTVLVAPLTVPRYGEREGQEPRCRSIENPASTIVPGGNGDQLVAANLVSYHSEKHGENARANAVDELIPTIDCANRFGLCAAFLGQNNGGFYDGEGRLLDDPMPTILANSRGHFPVVAAHIQRDFGTSTGHKIDQPVGTLTAEGGGKAALVASFLAQYNGTSTGQKIDEPMATATAQDRFGLVTVMLEGIPHIIVDIAMRMLQPKELYLAQGFRKSYIIDRLADGTPVTKSEQVKMVGNSVCPPMARALVAANCAWLIVPSRRMA